MLVHIIVLLEVIVKWVIGDDRDDKRIELFNAARWCGDLALVD